MVNARVFFCARATFVGNGIGEEGSGQGLGDCLKRCNNGSRPSIRIPSFRPEFKRQDETIDDIEIYRGEFRITEAVPSFQSQTQSENDSGIDFSRE